mmetsp:Transcript_93067/g.268836  ORF Transcript_93067/g.268836 Transcript_93067/m.268836 type:complete len:487 (+) Transcript_93067:232-1692(+)|eukprot:CAMPEP_0176048106 /NCGR_PEP_ID=MMETSP0120_2-20121206/23894_1 /TAXON_ID=160619 /ORGANISM="Kryptoperidinium foliaceum, Strain CCMP 1326" /LENGTH=486 /DNA_ID=CAMNT_0017381521 /DNA_START=162 /DNA_END=1622 /DNA_ORIENTATION=-
MAEQNETPQPPIAIQWKKYTSYELEVDPNQDDKAREIQLCNFSRPHMRAFHYAWWSFFVAFFVWFAVTPLLPDIQETLNLTDKEIWNSSIAGVGGTILVRFIVGPLCDKYGARILFSLMLCGAAIPCACIGFIHSSTGLIALRAFIGIAGGTFVTCQYWASRMFAKEVVGTANALVAGWGNLGASISVIAMGSYIFPWFSNMFDGDEEMAWRTASIVPSIVAFGTGVAIYYHCDDAPKGNYSEMKENGAMEDVSARTSFVSASRDWNTWVLFLQYGCCFGVELTMNNAIFKYFMDEFGLSSASSHSIGSIFGWMNLFARGLGGVMSDSMSETMGMKGRILSQAFLLLCEGVAVIIFAGTDTLAGAVIILIIFSLFVQAAEGTSYGIVPYVNPPFTGSVSGIVGAGGNVGAVVFGLFFREMSYLHAFNVMGGFVIASSFLSAFISIKGHRGLCKGEDMVVDKETGEIVEDAAVLDRSARPPMVPAPV